MNWLDPRQAARLAGVTSGYVCYLLKQGVIKGHKLDDGSWLVDRSSLRLWMEMRGQEKKSRRLL